MNTFADLSPAQIIASTTNPRKAFNVAKLQELAASIIAQGIHTPVIVRPLPASRLADTVGLKPRPEYELVAGERRLRAARLASEQGHKVSVPAMVRSLTDAEVLDIQLTENMQRDDLTHLEESDGIQLMIDKLGLSVDQVAAKLGLSRRSIFKRLSLQSLAIEVRAARAAGKIDDARAFEISRIPTQAGQIKALDWAQEASYGNEERPRIGVRQLREMINHQIMLRIEAARFDTNSKNLPTKGCDTPCSSCPKTSANNADLFDEPDAPNLCLDASCWHAKMEAHQEQQIAALEKKGFEVVTGEDAKGITPHQWVVNQKHPGYIRAATMFTTEKDGAHTDEDGEITYSAALGKRIKECDPKAVMHDQLQEPIVIIHQAKADAILVELGYITEEDAQENEEEQSLRAAPKDWKQDWKMQTEQRNIAAAARARVVKATMQAISQAPNAPAEALQSTDILRFLCKEFFEYVAFETDMIALAIGRPDLVGSEDELDIDAYIEQASEAELRDLWLTAHISHIIDMASPTEFEAKSLQAMLAAFSIDRAQIEAQVKAEIEAESQKTTQPDAPAAQPKGSGEGAQLAPKKSARAKKLSAGEAEQGIAAAMQGLDDAASASAVAPPSDPAVLAVGAKVQVTSNTDKLNMRQTKYAGKQGTITAKLGDRGWDVTFKGRTGGVSSFDSSELELVAA